MPYGVGHHVCLQSRGLSTISNTDVALCLDVTLFSIVTVGLSLFLFSFRFQVDSVYSSFPHSHDLPKDCGLSCPSDSNKYALSVTNFQDIVITLFFCLLYSCHSSIKQNLRSLYIISH